MALLAPQETGSTLVLSSLRSEAVKGFVTRNGTKMMKGDIQLRLSSLPPNTPRTYASSTPSTRLILAQSPTSTDLSLSQVVSVKTLINSCLDIVDVSRWTGQSSDASFISGQLRLLHDHLGEAKACLKGPVAGQDIKADIGGEWTTSSADDDSFEPPLPSYLSLHFMIQDASLVLTVRTLAKTSASYTPGTPSTDSSFSISGLSLRQRLLGLGPRLPNHDEVGETFQWRGREEVSVREKVRVESADPSLMSVAAKLSALEREVARWRANLTILMGQDADDD